MPKGKSNAILDEDEMLAWYGDEDNHYLLEKEGSVMRCHPFVCDFEVVSANGEIKLRGVKGEGLGYDLETKQLNVIPNEGA